jgi:hypothetical protein
MIHSGKRRAALITVSVVSLFGAALSAGPANAATAEPSATYQVGADSTDPLPAEVAVDEIPGTDGSDVSVATDTPSGFKLINPGIRRSDYVYDSDKAYQGAYECSGSTCTLAAEVTAQLHEVAIGGSSHTWRLTMTMQKYANARNLTWSYSSTYWCGVNVSGASDHLCTNGAAPSNASMSVNTEVNKPWGATNSITVFPMVQASTVFSDGVHVSTKFRGWDTLSRTSTTKLKATSGTG